MKQIPFSPPDITEVEIEAVTQALRSGWITTGPQTKRFEQRIRDYTGAAGAACLNSATAALELTLRLLGVGLRLVQPSENQLATGEQRQPLRVFPQINGMQHRPARRVNPTSLQALYGAAFQRLRAFPPRLRPARAAAPRHSFPAYGSANHTPGWGR